MKILLYNFGDYFAPHLETQADLIQQHLDRGDDVIKLVCNSQMPICRVNTEHRLMHCSLCLARRAAIRGLVHPNVQEKTFLNLKVQDRKAIADFVFDGTTIDDLKALRFGEFDIGLAVASTVIEETRDAYPKLEPLRQQISDWIGVSLATYLSVLNTLEDERPDCVYVFNGRRTYYRAVLRACQAKNVDYACHDGHRNLSRHTLVKNRLIHNIAGHCAEIEEVWQKGDPATRFETGSAFFEDQHKGRDLFKFAQSQQHGVLPETWNPERRNVCIFPGSEFEFASIGDDFIYPFYEDQTQGIIRLIESLEAADSPIHLNIRLHPHLKGDDNSSVRKLLSIQSRKATVIPPDSSVSSYALLFACEKTLTFGSTMGIEAVYWGKPSLMAGRCWYQTLGGTYNPASHDELIELLHADLQPKPKEAAVKYGYHQLCRGVEHVYYQRESLWKGKFKGRDVDDAIPWYWRGVLKLTFSRISPWLDSLWKVHQRYRRRQLGIQTIAKNYENAKSIGDPVDRKPAEIEVPTQIDVAG